VPDNGLLTLVANQGEIVAAREITNTKWLIGARLSSTFHGRDIFSPVAAHIAHGEDWTEVGPELAVSSLVRLNVPATSLDGAKLTAAVIGTDGPFGNLVTNADKDDFAKLGYALGDKVTASLDGKSFEIQFVKTFSDVPVGSPLFYIDSRGRLGLAVNQGSFAARYPVKIPAPIVISRKPAAK
jgi:S-adenosylmethionine hydrolase